MQDFGLSCRDMKKICRYQSSLLCWAKDLKIAMCEHTLKKVKWLATDFKKKRKKKSLPKSPVHKTLYPHNLVDCSINSFRAFLLTVPGNRADKQGITAKTENGWKGWKQTRERHGIFSSYFPLNGSEYGNNVLSKGRSYHTGILLYFLIKFPSDATRRHDARPRKFGISLSPTGP